MYGGDESQSELLQAIEAGRKHKIAAEVMSEFLDTRRDWKDTTRECNGSNSGTPCDEGISQINGQHDTARRTSRRKDE